jgi:predicted unusual protein kinase regulating ubiquinone biosynthesis (AarF/ABC1/UbiB family)
MFQNIFKNIFVSLSIFSYTFYSYISYKLNLSSFDDSIINICNHLTKHSYIFIKIFQWGIHDIYDLASTIKLTNYFNAFSNNVHYTSTELKESLIIVDELIRYASDSNDELVFEKKQNCIVPLNSGSVTLIYKAFLNNKPVIVKILRHNIKKKINDDISLILFLFTNPIVMIIIRRWLKFEINLKEIINNCKRMLIDQCDIQCEVKNTLLFKNILINNKNIVVPHVYTHFTDTFHNVIIMEYLHGPIAKNIPIDHLKNFSKIMQIFYLESFFKYNLLHGDFHLGNIIILDKDVIGIIDMGIVYPIETEISNQLFDVLFLNANKYNKKNFYKSLSIQCDLFCIHKEDSKRLFNFLKSDKEFENLAYSKFSIKTLNLMLRKAMIMNIKINTYISNLLFSFLSGLQTIESTIKNIDHDNKSLTTSMKFLISSFNDETKL